MPRNVKQVADGDTRFLGIAPRLDPATLQEGMVSEARNMRFRNGVAESRKGMYKTPWANNITPEIDAKVRPFGEVHGVGVFRNPNNLEFVIIAADNTAYYTRQNNNPLELALPTGVSITGTVNFTQAFNKLIMWRGEDFAPLVMTSEDDGFEDLLQQWDSTAAYAVDDEVAFGPLVSVSSITHTGGVATVTTAVEHGYVTGADVTIAGSSDTEFNGRFNVTVTSTTVFTYEVTSSTSPAGGTITSTNNKDYYKCTVITSAGESPVTTSGSWSAISTIMPNSTHGVFIANRVTAPTTYDASSTAYGNHRQFVAVSDALDHVHSYFNQIFRVNFGSDSEILDLLVYDENRLLVLTDKDVSMVTGYIVEGTNATFGSSVAIQPVIQNYGVSGRGASVVVGSDVYFYASRRGIVSLAQTEQSKVRGVDIPLSEPIQPLIDRIDPRSEDKIRLAWWDNKLYVAAPLIDLSGDDTSTGNNALLVYDFLNQAWSSHDSGTAICPAEFFVAQYNNSQRLFYVGTDGFINLVEENDAGDDLADLTQDDGLATTDFESYLLTRGYHTNDIDHRDFRTAAVNISTWNPNFTLKAVGDGVNESQTLVSNRTKSRVTYYRPFDAEPFQEHNANGDHSNPYREDYSVQLDVDFDTLLTESGDVLCTEAVDGSGEAITLSHEGAVGGFTLGDGVQFNRMQETLESFALSTRMGRYTQLELSNISGRIKINQATLTNQQGSRAIGVKS